jgi:transposase-like protein
MARAADPRKQDHWLRQIRRWHSSRLTVRDYCARHRLSEPSFYSWKRTLQQRGLLADGSDDPRPLPTRAERPLFLPVTIPQAQASPRIDIVLPDGLSVRVAAGFDAATLRHLLALLRE